WLTLHPDCFDVGSNLRESQGLRDCCCGPCLFRRALSAILCIGDRTCRVNSAPCRRLRQCDGSHSAPHTGKTTTNTVMDEHALVVRRRHNQVQDLASVWVWKFESGKCPMDVVSRQWASSRNLDQHATNLVIGAVMSDGGQRDDSHT